MFRPYMWAIFRLWFNLQSRYTNTPHILYSWSVSWISTWRRPKYRVEICSCILIVLLGKIWLCSTVRVIHKILWYISLLPCLDRLNTLGKNIPAGQVASLTEIWKQSWIIPLHSITSFVLNFFNKEKMKTFKDPYQSVLYFNLMKFTFVS